MPVHGTMRHMPAIPESTRSSIIVRLLDHAEHNWPQLAKVQARYHGSFAYITGVLPGGEQIPLFRLRYGGSAHSFGFAIYSPARDRYEDARPAHRTAHRQPARSPRHRLHRPPRSARPRTRTLTPDTNPRRINGATHLADQSTSWPPPAGRRRRRRSSTPACSPCGGRRPTRCSTTI